MRGWWWHGHSYWKRRKEASLQFLLLSSKVFLSANEGSADSTSFSPLSRRKWPSGKSMQGITNRWSQDLLTSNITCCGMPKKCDSSYFTEALSPNSDSSSMTASTYSASSEYLENTLFYPSLFSDLLLKLHIPWSKLLLTLYKQLFRHCCDTIHAHRNENERMITKIIKRQGKIEKKNISELMKHNMVQFCSILSYELLHFKNTRLL